MARNFAEERFNILYPRIDWRGTSSGEVECEFPIYQFVLAFLYKIFGVHEAIGRFISLLFSLSTVIGVYLVSKRVATASVGLWAAFFFAILPMPVFFGRTVMPEALLVAACTYAVYWFLKWTDSNSLRSLFVSATALAIACLIKPPTLYMGLPLAFLAIRKHKALALTHIKLWIFAGLVMGSLALWYVHAHDLKTTTGLTFGVWEYGSDKWGNWNLVGSWAFWDKIFIQRVPDLLLSYLGLPLLIIGLVRPSCSAEEKVFSLWLVGILVFIVIVAKGVFVHDYYLLPATVPVCYFLGKATSWGLSKNGHQRRWVRVSFSVCITGMIVIAFITYGKLLSKESPNKSPAFQVSQVARRDLPKDALILAVDKGDPMMLYYSQKKGWHCSPHDLTDNFVSSLATQGARFILGVHKDFSDDNAMFNLERLLEQNVVLLNNGSFFIVRIVSKKQ